MTEEVNEYNQQPPVADNKVPTDESKVATDLNISDLVAVKNVIEVATQRGAFRAAELESVGKAYNKLSLFLESVTARKE
jgi:hypothetical protein